MKKLVDCVAHVDCIPTLLDRFVLLWVLMSYRVIIYPSHCRLTQNQWVLDAKFRKVWSPLLDEWQQINSMVWFTGTSQGSHLFLTRRFLGLFWAASICRKTCSWFWLISFLGRTFVRKIERRRTFGDILHSSSHSFIFLGSISPSLFPIELWAFDKNGGCGCLKVHPPLPHHPGLWCGSTCELLLGFSRVGSKSGRIIFRWSWEFISPVGGSSSGFREFFSKWSWGISGVYSTTGPMVMANTSTPAMWVKTQHGEDQDAQEANDGHQKMIKNQYVRGPTRQKDIWIWHDVAECLNLL